MYNDLHYKFTGRSSWVKPEMSVLDYTSKFAPKGDGNNNPEGYANRIVEYVNNKTGSKVAKSDSLDTLLASIEAKGYDPIHTITEAQMLVENSAKRHPEIKKLFK